MWVYLCTFVIRQFVYVSLNVYASVRLDIFYLFSIRVSVKRERGGGKEEMKGGRDRESIPVCV